MSKLFKKRLTTFQIIILGFSALILVGTLLLMLPVSSAGKTVTPFGDAFFTSVSAVCVTGLVVKDTATYWSVFGQTVIILLIQIGGLGVVTSAAALTLISGKKISLMQRSTMSEALTAPDVGGTVRLTLFILKSALIVEAAGALIMMPVFCRDFGPSGVWKAFFHSISAFCNAGFDIMGTPGSEYQSLTAYAQNPVISITLMLLIIVGGLGFLTWDDVRKNGFKIKRYKMQSKVIIVTSVLLIMLPAAFYFFFEFSEGSIKNRLLFSFFQAITPRTAGFNTVSLTAMSGASRALMLALMLVGGSPGSTAGGMKTTTLAVLFANTGAIFRRRNESHFFGRRIDENTIKNASAILILYLSLFLCGAIAISAIEGLPIGDCLFETASAVGTVGLTLGITPSLGTVSRLILIAFMFTGRVGGLTIAYAAFSEPDPNLSKLPKERITVG
ncbi:MAG: potassium transporter TrkG [Firmicutes bacterium]|nr:potassium transporter TrkG [Bacillota bacterium]